MCNRVLWLADQQEEALAIYDITIPLADSVNWIEIENEKDYEGMIGRLRGGDIDGVKS